MIRILKCPVSSRKHLIIISKSKYYFYTVKKLIKVYVFCLWSVYQKLIIKKLMCIKNLKSMLVQIIVHRLIGSKIVPSVPNWHLTTQKSIIIYDLTMLISILIDYAGISIIYCYIMLWLLLLLFNFGSFLLFLLLKSLIFFDHS
jgi:hypothetical protein